jgi:hypothetical protein
MGAGIKLGKLELVETEEVPQLSAVKKGRAFVAFERFGRI